MATDERYMTESTTSLAGINDGINFNSETFSYNNDEQYYQLDSLSDDELKQALGFFLGKCANDVRANDTKLFYDPNNKEDCWGKYLSDHEFSIMSNIEKIMQERQKSKEAAKDDKDAELNDKTMSDNMNIPGAVDATKEESVRAR